MSGADQQRIKRRKMYRGQKKKCWVCRKPMPCPDLTREQHRDGAEPTSLDPVTADIKPTPKGWNGPFHALVHRGCREEKQLKASPDGRNRQYRSHAQAEARA